MQNVRGTATLCLCWLALGPARSVGGLEERNEYTNCKSLGQNFLDASVYFVSDIIEYLLISALCTVNLKICLCVVSFPTRSHAELLPTHVKFRCACPL